MKRLLISLLVLAFLFTLCGCSKEEKTTAANTESTASGNQLMEKPITLGIAHPQAIDHPQSKFVERVKERVEKETGGMIKIAHYPADQLGSADEVYRQTVEGSNAIYIGDFNQSAQYVEELSVFNLPYIFKDPEHMEKVLTSDIAQELYDKLEAINGMKFLMPIYFGDRVMSTNKIRATTPEELKGVRIRCPQGTVSVDSIASLGCTPVPMALSEVYMALQTGAIDGQENPLQTFVNNRFYEVQDTIILTNHTIGFSTIMANGDIWNSIPKEYQDLILKIMQEEAVTLKEEIINSTAALREECEAQGVEFIEPDVEAFREHSLAYSRNIYSEYSELMDSIAEIE